MHGFRIPEVESFTLPNQSQYSLCQLLRNFHQISLRRTRDGGTKESKHPMPDGQSARTGSSLSAQELVLHGNQPGQRRRCPGYAQVGDGQSIRRLLCRHLRSVGHSSLAQAGRQALHLFRRELRELLSFHPEVLDQDLRSQLCRLFIQLLQLCLIDLS